MNKLINQLSDEGIVSILTDYDHIVMSSIEGRDEMNEVLQCNLDSGLIDEIELITVLSGE